MVHVGSAADEGTSVMHHAVMLEEMGAAIMRVPSLEHAGARLVRLLASRKHADAARLLDSEPRFSARFAPDGRVHVDWDGNPLISISGQEVWAARANEGSGFWRSRAVDAIRKLDKKPWDSRGWHPDDEGHG